MTKPDPAKSTDQDLIRKNARLGLMVLVVVAGMIALSFAAVPFYDMFCRVTGFGGTTQTADALPGTVLDRTITIKFNADTGLNMPWDFHPEEREIDVKLGQRGLTSYYAHNRANQPTAGTALYNVTPLKAGKYFHKIQCFCFDEQILQAGQEVSMPVLFYVDPAMNEDRNMDDVQTITLSYTFFPARSEELDKALEEFYNDDEDLSEPAPRQNPG